MYCCAADRWGKELAYHDSTTEAMSRTEYTVMSYRISDMHREAAICMKSNMTVYLDSLITCPRGSDLS